MLTNSFYKNSRIHLVWFFTVLFFSISLFSCGGKKNKKEDTSMFSSEENLPDSILPREKFVQVIADVLIAESAVVQQYDPKESKLMRFEKYRYNIYRKHAIDSNYFKKNYNYYLKMPKRAELFLFIVEDTLQARKDSLRIE